MKCEYEKNLKLFDKCVDVYISMLEKGFPEDLTKELYGLIIDIRNDLGRYRNAEKSFIVRKTCCVPSKEQHSQKRWVTIDGRHIDIGGDGDSGSGGGGSSGGASSSDDRQTRHLYNNMSKEERKEVIGRGQSEPKAVFSYDRPDNKAMSYLQKVSKEPNTFDVISHGSVDSMEFFKQDYPNGDRRGAIDAYILSCILKGRSDYKAFKADCEKRGVKPTVRLLSCNTGNTTNTGNCFAQLLANELGHCVTAPTETLYTNPNGKCKIGRNNTGKMKTFYSRKN